MLLLDFGLLLGWGRSDRGSTLRVSLRLLGELLLLGFAQSLGIVGRSGGFGGRRLDGIGLSLLVLDNLGLFWLASDGLGNLGDFASVSSVTEGKPINCLPGRRLLVVLVEELIIELEIRVVVVLVVELGVVVGLVILRSRLVDVVSEEVDSAVVSDPPRFLARRNSLVTADLEHDGVTSNESKVEGSLLDLIVSTTRDHVIVNSLVQQSRKR